jgi:hypothetical protein
VLDRCLAHTGELMAQADRLPGVLKSRRLAMESAIIVKIAHKLIAELARRDPLAERIELTRMQFLACGVRGVVGGLFA